MGLALGEASLQVVLGARIPAQAGEHDGVEGGVGLPVAAAVETAALGLAGGRLDGAGAAQGREGRLAVESLGVVAGGEEEGCGGVGADAVAVQQGGCAGVDAVVMCCSSSSDFLGRGAGCGWPSRRRV